MGILFLVYRGLFFVLLTTVYVVAGILGSVLGGHRAALHIQRLWCRTMLWLFGVETVLYGTRPTTGLIMPNHQSYVDIWIIPKYAISVYVAKIEVKKIPLFGWGTAAVGTVFVERESKASRQRTKNAIRERLKQGRSVTIFPEGTTGYGDKLLPLKPGMFFVAAEEKFPIIPVFIFYEDPGLAWVGDDNPVNHFFRNFGKARTKAHVIFGDPIIGTNGEQLMIQVRDWKLAQLEKFRNRFRE